MINPFFLGPPDYNYDCSGTNVYAVYFELEDSTGGATVSIQAPGCAGISNCLSCPNPGKCQYCKPPFTVSGDSSSCVCSSGVINLAGDACIATCPAFSSSNGAQCVCNGGFQVSQDQTSCECQTGYLDISMISCVATCPALSSPSGSVCQCNSPFTSDGTNCVCSGSDVVNLKGDACISACPDRSTAVNDQCVCNTSYKKSTDEQMCVCQSGSLGPDGISCLVSCPGNSLEDENDVCQCLNGFSGSNCDYCADYISIDGMSCVTTCPDRSTGSGGACGCTGIYTPGDNTCICPGGDLVDLDGVSCVSACPTGASDSNSDGICECDNGLSGVLCDTCSGVWAMDGSCMTSCPDRSSDLGGTCMCDFPPYVVSVGNICVCIGTDLLDIDGTSCVSECSEHASDGDGDGICECDLPFVLTGGACVCASGELISPGGSTCVNSCPSNSSDDGGQCKCDVSYLLNGESCSLTCDGLDVISLDGTICINPCPDHSSNSGGQCVCDGSLLVSGDGKSCVCPGASDIINVDGLSCIDLCPEHSSLIGEQCICDDTFVISGQDCVCDSGQYLSLSGDVCESFCPQGSAAVNGQCQCDPVFSRSGNSCICPNTGDKINIGVSACISQCPPYSFESSGQCFCNAAFQTNGDTCGCAPGLVVNLAGTGCISGCPQYSSQSNGACECYTGFTVSGDGNSCECSNYISVDGLSCVSSCPTHSSVVGAQCICDESFVPNGNDCQCDTDKVLNLMGDYCIDSCPFGAYESSGQCYSCDSSCKTCSGMNSNECLACYSGYQLSTSNTCSAITKTTTTSVEVAKTTKTMSSASLAASSVASVGNSGAIRVSLVGNMFHYLKFMNISYSEQLSDMLENLNSQFLPFTLGVGIPRSMQDESNYKTLAYQFTKYGDIHPSFLMNFWDDLSILVLVIVVVGALVALQFVLNKFTKEKTAWWKVLFSKASLMTQSFLLTYTYNDLGSVIFFGLLDFKSAKSYSGVHVLNLIVAISLLLAEIGILIVHYTLLVKYRRIKRARLNLNRENELQEFLGKHENLKAFFEDFNDFSFIQQGFLLVAIFRDMLSNLILVTLYQYPLAESTCLMAFSLLMIVYILYSGPFKDILNAIQQILCELILLLVNTCVFINAVLDHIGSNDDELRKKLGSIVVVSNSMFNFVPLAFLAIALWQLSKELHSSLKGWMNKRKVADLVKTEEFHLKSEAGDSSKMIFRGLTFEGSGSMSLFTGVVGENRNMTETIQQHKLTEDLEILGSSQDQTMSLGSKIISRDNTGVFEMKLDGDQGKDELILEDVKEKGIWSNRNGLRKVKVKRGRFPPQQNILKEGDLIEEGNDVGK